MEVINLAHGSLFALGAYFALFVINPEFTWLPEYQEIPIVFRYILALVIAPCGVAIVGMGLEFCLRRTYGKDPLYGLLLTFGASLVLEETIRIVWGSVEYSLTIPKLISGAFIFANLIFSNYRFFAAGFSIFMIIVLWFFIERTRYGAIVKAGAHDDEMVRALGINLKRLRLYVFGFGTALAGIAGIIMAPIWGIRPHVGVDAVIPAFLIIALGGVGSFWGSVIAGLLVGLVVALTGSYASSLSLVSMYVLLIAVVTFRSRGLFGKISALDK